MVDLLDDAVLNLSIGRCESSWVPDESEVSDLTATRGPLAAFAAALQQMRISVAGSGEIDAKLQSMAEAHNGLAETLRVVSRRSTAPIYRA